MSIIQNTVCKLYRAPGQSLVGKRFHIMINIREGWKLSIMHSHTVFVSLSVFLFSIVTE